MDGVVDHHRRSLVLQFIFNGRLWNALTFSFEKTMIEVAVSVQLSFPRSVYIIFPTFFFQLIRPHVIIIIQIPKASSVWTCHCGFRWWAVGPAGLVSFYGLCIMTDKKPIYLMQIGYFYSNSIWLTGSAWFPPPLGNSVCRVYYDCKYWQWIVYPCLK